MIRRDILVVMSLLTVDPLGIKLVLCKTLRKISHICFMAVFHQSNLIPKFIFPYIF